MSLNIAVMALINCHRVDSAASTLSPRSGGVSCGGRDLEHAGPSPRYKHRMFLPFQFRCLPVTLIEDRLTPVAFISVIPAHFHPSLRRISSHISTWLRNPHCGCFHCLSSSFTSLAWRAQLSLIPTTWMPSPSPSSSMRGSGQASWTSLPCGPSGEGTLPSRTALHRGSVFHLVYVFFSSLIFIPLFYLLWYTASFLSFSASSI